MLKQRPVAGVGIETELRIGEPFKERDRIGRHGRDAENGCVMPSLSADVGRAGDRVRKTYQKRMRLLIERMTRSMTGPDAQRRKQAWAVLALMVGTITVARALPEGPERQELVAAALANALKTAKL